MNLNLFFSSRSQSFSPGSLVSSNRASVSPYKKADRVSASGKEKCWIFCSKILFYYFLKIERIFGKLSNEGLKSKCIIFLIFLLTKTLMCFSYNFCKILIPREGGGLLSAGCGQLYPGHKGHREAGARCQDALGDGDTPRRGWGLQCPCGFETVHVQTRVSAAAVDNSSAPSLYHWQHQALQGLCHGERSGNIVITTSATYM